MEMATVKATVLLPLFCFMHDCPERKENLIPSEINSRKHARSVIEGSKAHLPRETEESNTKWRVFLLLAVLQLSMLSVFADKSSRFRIEFRRNRDHGFSILLIILEVLEVGREE